MYFNLFLSYYPLLSPITIIFFFNFQIDATKLKNLNVNKVSSLSVATLKVLLISWYNYADLLEAHILFRHLIIMLYCVYLVLWAFIMCMTISPVVCIIKINLVNLLIWNIHWWIRNWYWSKGLIPNYTERWSNGKNLLPLVWKKKPKRNRHTLSFINILVITHKFVYCL